MTELKYGMYHWMYIPFAINNDCQSRLLIVFGQIARFCEISKNITNPPYILVTGVVKSETKCRLRMPDEECYDWN